MDVIEKVRPAADARLEPSRQFPCEEVRADWGPCHSCSCRGFKPTGKENNICADCGHHWTRHW